MRTRTRDERTAIDTFLNPKEEQYQAEIEGSRARRRRDKMRGYLSHTELMALQARHAQLSS
jgi:hypothetical protein